jgi:hypothetical protein
MSYLTICMVSSHTKFRGNSRSHLTQDRWDVHANIFSRIILILKYVFYAIFHNALFKPMRQNTTSFNNILYYGLMENFVQTENYKLVEVCGTHVLPLLSDEWSATPWGPINKCWSVCSRLRARSQPWQSFCNYCKARLWEIIQIKYMPRTSAITSWLFSYAAARP